VKSSVRVNPEIYRDRQVIRATWSNIKDRCLNPGNAAYPNYGGRGITLWTAWREDSTAFTDWVLENLGPRPEGQSIDRIDVNGHYEPGNLRWATPAQQMSNTRAQLDPMNAIIQTPGAATFGYRVTRDKTLLAEYGFTTPEDAAHGRDNMLSVLEDQGPDAARKLIESRKAGRVRKREKIVSEARQAAQAAKDEAAMARLRARTAATGARELERVTKRQVREDAKADRAARFHRMNETMTLADIARAEGVSVAHVSIELKRYGHEAIAHNATGYPGVKRTRHGTYEARKVIEGKRITLGTRKTPEEAAELYRAARDLPHA
jgi:hypothetical protein